MLILKNVCFSSLQIQTKCRIETFWSWVWQCQSVWHDLHATLIGKITPHELPLLWKWMKETYLKWSQEARGEALTPENSSSVVDPNQKRQYLAFPTGRTLPYSSAGRIFPCPATSLANKKIPQFSQWETITTLVLSFFWWTYVQCSPSQLLYIYMKLTLPFDLWT